MASSTKTSRKGSSKSKPKATKTPKPKAAKATKAVKASKAAPAERTPSQVRELLAAFKGGDYRAYCKKNGLNFNETGIPLPTDDSGEKYAKAVDRANSAFNESSTHWTAGADYGRQHYNGFGFMHRIGLTRLNDESLALLLIQAGEELSQRAAHSGSDLGNKRIDTAAAANHVAGISAWLASRPAAIAENRRQQHYKIVQEDLGLTGVKSAAEAPANAS